MASDFQVSTSHLVNTMGTRISLDIPYTTLMERSLFDTIHRQLVTEAVHRILADNGKELIYDVLERRKEILNDMFNKIKLDLSSFIRELVDFQIAFEKGQLCKRCSHRHRDFELAVDHCSIFEKMDNLTFVEQFQSKIAKWEEGMKNMVCPDTRSL